LLDDYFTDTPEIKIETKHIPNGTKNANGAVALFENAYKANYDCCNKQDSGSIKSFNKPSNPLRCEKYAVSYDEPNRRNCDNKFSKRDIIVEPPETTFRS